MTIQTPTVIIGLGGIGSEIVERIERMTQEKKQPFKRYIRDNIEFVIMDTDENSIRQRRNQGYNGHSVSLSGDVTVGKCLEWDEDARENWYPESGIFDLKSLSEGAGQVRAISRLAFQRAIRTGRLHSLHKAIDNLYYQTESSTNQNLKIIIVSTLAGGTGSGCVLPLALYLKHYIRNRYSSSEAKINACLLLPDILVSESEKIANAEKENLYANAYSTVKELSYFMHKSDNEIRGDDIYINLPEDESNRLVRNEKLPFDFCFLFGRYTSEIHHIGTIEAYKKAITRCLYTQFVGSFSGTYFSYEDNMTVTNIAKMNTFSGKEQITQSHYASANCFVVSYPYQEIKEYLSLRWANEMMEEEWMKFDKEASRIEVEQRRSGRQNVGLKSNADYFLTAVESLAGSEDVEAQELGKKKSQAGQYLSHLFNYIKTRAEKKMTAWRQAKRDVEDMRKNPKDWTEGNISVLMELHVVVNRSVMEGINDLVSAILHEVCQIHDNNSNLKPYYIEYYFYDPEKREYETPNAIRYFLCQLVNEITNIHHEKRKVAEDARTAMKAVRKELSTTEMSEKANAYSSEIWSRRRKEIREDILGKYDIFLEKSFETLIEEASLSCLEKIKNYISMILCAYDSFFYGYKDISAYCKRKIDGLEKVLCSNNVQGADMLVCASKECLDSMLEKMQLDPAYYKTGGEISEWIYRYCYKKKEDKHQVGSFQQKDGILEKWIHMFENKFGSFFDINLFQAFTEEVLYKKETIEKNKYIIEVLDRAEMYYSAPLLTLCRKDGQEGKAYCIYSPKLKNDMEYREVVEKYFETNESICDEHEMDVDDKKIVFYKNRYGLEAFNVDFFASGKGVKGSFEEGEGYKAYLMVLEKRTGETEKAKLTPHIDKTWHRRNRMPDIGPEIEAKYFQRAVQALLIYVIKRKISFEKGKMGYQGKTNQSIGNMIDYFIGCVIEAQNIVEEARGEIKENPQSGDWYDLSTIKGNMISMLKEYYEELKSYKGADAKIIDAMTANMLQAIGEIFFWIRERSVTVGQNPFSDMVGEWNKTGDGKVNGKKVEEMLKFLQKQWEDN